MNTPDEQAVVRSMRLVDPTAEIEMTTSGVITPRLQSLQGARIAIIDTGKYMAKPFLDATCTLLEAQQGVAGFDYYRKTSRSVPMPPEEIARLTRSCAAVIHGISD